jgi:hypothetical protein
MGFLGKTTHSTALGCTASVHGPATVSFPPHLIGRCRVIAVAASTRHAAMGSVWGNLGAGKRTFANSDPEKPALPQIVSIRLQSLGRRRQAFGCRGPV